VSLGKVSQGNLVHRVEPEYPPAARQGHIHGTVVLCGTIAKDGALRNLRAFSGPEELIPSAMMAVEQWRSAPNRSVTISSWIVQFAEAKKLQYADNRGPDIHCYNPEYTFVEKVQAVVRKYGQFKSTGKLPANFLRHYYDIHRLLDVEAVQQFIGTPEYLEHKKKRFKSLDHDVARSGAFTIEDESIRKQFEAEYSKTAPLYYRGQFPLGTILARIQKDLGRL
jgi:hypothetical protein